MAACKRHDSSSENHAPNSKILKLSPVTDTQTAEEESYFNALPLEILDMILSYLSRRFRKNARLVCKLWYDRAQFNETLHLSVCRKHAEHEFCCCEHHKYLENCGLKRISLEFDFADVTSHQLPVSVWENLGARIHSLKFFACPLGDQVVKDIVLLCENLQVLEIGLTHFDPEISLCSLETLETLNVIRKTLHTLEIYSTRFCYLAQKSKFPDLMIDIEKWKRMFCALRRIFPHVTHYRSGSLFTSRYNVYFQMKFSLDSAEQVDESGLISALGISMSLNNAIDWRSALQALSTVSLTSVTLFVGRDSYNQEDRDVLMKFFSDHEQLERIELKFREDRTLRHSNMSVPVMSPESIISMLFHILDKCTKLREFYFLNNLLYRLNETQLAQIVKKTSKLTELVIHDILIRGCTMETRISSTLGVFIMTEISLLAPHYTHLQHLILGKSQLYCKDIPNICKYLINLKTLEINVTYWDFQKDTFKRLQNLERLTIHASYNHNHKLKTSDWYEEFEFPKLRYLYSFLPEDVSFLNCMGTKMPALKEVDFSQTVCMPDNNCLGKYSYPVDIFRDVDMTKFFARCPKLQSLHYCYGTYFYEPFTQQAIFSKK